MANPSSARSSVGPSQQLWNFRLSADVQGLSAKLRISSGNHPQGKQQHRFFFFPKKNSSSSVGRFSSSPADSDTTSVCHVSLQVKARRFLLKLKIAASKIRDLKMYTFFRFNKVALEVKGERSSVVQLTDKPRGWRQRSSILQFFQATEMQRSSLLDAREDGLHRSRKGSVFAYGFAIASCLFYILKHLVHKILHLPSFFLNSGFSLLSFLGQKRYQKRSSMLGRMWQSLRICARFLQMGVSILRKIFIVKTAVTAMLFGVLAGLILLNQGGFCADINEAITSLSLLAGTRRAYINA